MQSTIAFNLAEVDIITNELTNPLISRFVDWAQTIRVDCERLLSAEASILGVREGSWEVVDGS